MIIERDLLSSIEVKSRVNLLACSAQDFDFSLKSSS